MFPDYIQVAVAVILPAESKFWTAKLTADRSWSLHSCMLDCKLLEPRYNLTWSWQHRLIVFVELHLVQQYDPRPDQTTCDVLMKF